MNLHGASVPEKKNIINRLDARPMLHQPSHLYRLTIVRGTVHGTAVCHDLSVGSSLLPRSAAHHAELCMMFERLSTYAGHLHTVAFEYLDDLQGPEPQRLIVTHRCSSIE